MSFAIAGTVLTVGTTAYAANRASAASKAQGRAAGNATEESARQYDQTRNDLASGRNLYDQSNNALARLFGFSTPGTAGSGGEFLGWDAYLAANPDVAADPYFSKHPDVHYQRHGQAEGRQLPTSPKVAGTPGSAGGAADLSGFFASPDYQFRRDEGMRGLERTAAARGGAFSGNALRALNEFNSNLASGEFGNYFNRLATMAGMGQTATNQTAAYGAEHANNASRNALYAGDARASGINDQANIIGQGINQLGGIAGYYSNRRQPVAYGGTGYGGYPTTPGYGDGVRYA